MPVRRISRSQAILAFLVVAATLCSAYVLAFGPRTAASTEEGRAGAMPPRFYAGEAVARVIDSYGSVTIVRPPHGEERYTRYLSPVAEGLALFPGDQIWTGADSWVEIDFGDEVRVRIDARSRVEIVSGLWSSPGAPAASGDLPAIKLYLGDLWASVLSLVSRFTNFSIETPTAIAGVRGTLFRVSVDILGKTSVSVYEGVVAVSTPEERAAEVLVASGQFTHVIAGRRPEAPAPNSTEFEAEWERRSAWVLAHFERKEAYEQRLQLAATGTETAASQEGVPAPPAQPPEDAGPRSTGSTRPAGAPPAAADTSPSTERLTAQEQVRETPSEPPASAATIGLASFGAPAEPKKDEDAEDSEAEGGDAGEKGADAGEGGAESGSSSGGNGGVSGEEAATSGDGTAGDRGASGVAPEAVAEGRTGGGLDTGDALSNAPSSSARSNRLRSDRSEARLEVRRLVAEELASAREKIAEQLEAIDVELDRLWSSFEEALNLELDRLGAAIARRLEDGEGR